LWYLYVVRCRDESLYTGITTDVDRRVRQHTTGKGAKYTRSRSPVFLVASWEAGTKSDALRIEIKFKRLTRFQKQEAILKCQNQTDLKSFIDSI